MSSNLNNRDKAVIAWAPAAPAWVLLLADACDRTSQRAAADRLGMSGGYVSRVVNRSYAGSYEEAERLVRATFGAEEVGCPLYGTIQLKTCLRFRRRKGPPRNPMQIDHDRVCPGCPNNTDRPHEED